MKTEKKIIPKIKFAISYFIEEQLSILKMTNELFLEKLFISEKEYNQIIKSQEIISKLFAEKLSNIFSTSTNYWINIDKNYKEWVKL